MAFQALQLIIISTLASAWSPSPFPPMIGGSGGLLCPPTSPFRQLQHAQSINCASRLNLFTENTKAENQLPPDSTLSSLMKENQLLIIGESHSLSARSVYPKTLENLKGEEKKLNCLFVEANERFFERMKSDFHVGMTETIAKAKELQLAVIPVDLANGSTDKVRNEVMATKIEENFKPGPNNQPPKCQKAVLIVGANHMSSKPHLAERSIPSEFCLPVIPVIRDTHMFESAKTDEFEYYYLFHSN